MGFRLGVVFVGVLVILGDAHARPGQLKEQRFEFQEFHSNSYNEHVEANAPKNARMEVIPWSRQHPNDVNAFAEVFRQQYNQMVEHNNRMMQMHQQTMSNMFRPVTYELYHIPNGQSWNNFFGSQQHYVQNQVQQMTHQLVQDLQQGTVTQQDLMNPEFFVNQAANELDRVHQSHHVSGATEFHEINNHQEFEDQQQQYGGFETQHDQHDEQQRHQAVFMEDDQHNAHATARDQHTDAGHFGQDVPLKKILVYNSETNSYEFVYVNSVDEVTSQSDNQHTQTSYIQNLPPVAFNNDKVTNLDREVESIEVHTPAWIETPKSNQQSIRTQDQEQSAAQTNVDEYYGSTYDQQPIYDLRYLDSLSTTKATPSYRVVPLDRKKEIKTTTPRSVTTTTTTSVEPITESSVMSMLPHKKAAVNYTEMYHKVREELNKHMQNETDTTKEETHFMGMTSNREQTKLQYEVVSKEPVTSGEGRGDQPSVGEDYVSEEMVESEPGIGYYPVDTEVYPTIPTTTVKPTVHCSTPKPAIINHNPYYQAPLAPFPSRKPDPNPYYSAPLAPFPNSIATVPSNDYKPPNLQYAHFSEVDSMNQETQSFNHGDVAFSVADVVQDTDVQQQHVEFDQQQQHFEEQIALDYEDTQQFETLQTTYIDLNTHSAGFQQMQQAPLGQISAQPVLAAIHNEQQEEEVPGHVVELTTPVNTTPSSSKSGWFKKQWNKLKNTFQS